MGEGLPTPDARLPARAPGERTLLPPLIASLLGQAIVVLASLTPPVLAVPASEAYGFSPHEIGFFTSILYITGMTSAAAGGGLVLRLGAVRVSQLCLVCGAVGMLMCASGFLPLAILGALCAGAGYGPMTPASSHLLAPVTSERWRPFVFSIKQTSVPLGGVLAGTLLPFFVDVGGWRGALFIVAGMTLAGAVAMQPLRRTYDSDRDPTAPLRISVLGPVRAVLGHPRLRRLAMVSLQFACLQICISAFFVAFLSDGLGYSLAQAGLALAIAQGAGVAGRILWGAIASKTIGARRMLMILAIVCGAGGFSTMLMSSDWPFWMVLVLGAAIGASGLGWNGLFLSEIVAVTSARESAAATGGALFFTFGGAVVGPALFSGIIGLTGSYSAAFALGGAWVLPAAWLLYKAGRGR